MQRAYTFSSLRAASTAGLACARALKAAGMLVAAALAGSASANGIYTAHHFAVANSGVATITVPIQVPRGIGGMEPQLALNYASDAGNGLLGQGWNLSGTSAITRCPRTELHDGVRGAVTFGANDRFCLDGQRLVLVLAQAPTAPLTSAALWSSLVIKIQQIPSLICTTSYYGC